MVSLSSEQSESFGLFGGFLRTAGEDAEAREMRGNGCQMRAKWMQNACGMHAKCLQNACKMLAECVRNACRMKMHAE